MTRYIIQAYESETVSGDLQWMKTMSFICSEVACAFKKAQSAVEAEKKALESMGIVPNHTPKLYRLAGVEELQDGSNTK